MLLCEGKVDASVWWIFINQVFFGGDNKWMERKNPQQIKKEGKCRYICVLFKPISTTKGDI